MAEREDAVTGGPGTDGRSPGAPTMVAGLDVGGTKTLAVAVDVAALEDAGSAGAAPAAPGEAAVPGLVATVRRPTVGGDPARLLASATDVLTELARTAGVQVDGFAAVGVGVPGLVDRRAGTVRHAVNLGLGDEPVPLAAHLGAVARAPVIVDNDVNMAAVGAAAGLGCAADLAYLSVGTGLAAGLLLDGRIRHGAHGAAGEIGHLPIDPHGPLCECGQRGCLEVLSSGTAIAARWPSAHGELSAASALLAAADAGDAEARAVLADIGGHLAGAVALLAQTVDPAVVVLGGGVSEAGPGLLAAVQGALRDRAARSPILAAIDLADRVALVPPGVPAGALGAALVAWHCTRAVTTGDGTAAPATSPPGPPDAVASGTS
jgi:glucokinase